VHFLLDKQAVCCRLWCSSRSARACPWWLKVPHEWLGEVARSSQELHTIPGNGRTRRSTSTRRTYIRKTCRYAEHKGSHLVRFRAPPSNVWEGGICLLHWLLCLSLHWKAIVLLASFTRPVTDLGL